MSGGGFEREERRFPVAVTSQPGPAEAPTRKLLAPLRKRLDRLSGMPEPVATVEEHPMLPLAPSCEFEEAPRRVSECPALQAPSAE